MSTLAYGALTRKREESAVGESTSRQPPGLKPYVDVLAGLVPAEVLVVHTAILSFTTTTTEDVAGQVRTVITARGTLTWVFIALVVISMLLYVLSHAIGGNWDRWDYLRVFIPPLAFVGWTMAQRATAFDAVWPSLKAADRYAATVIGALMLAAVSTALSYQADHKLPRGRQPMPQGGSSGAATRQ